MKRITNPTAVALLCGVTRDDRRARSIVYDGGSSAEIVVGHAESDGEYAVVRYHVRPGEEPPLHTHTQEDETVYVVDGEITAIVGDTEVRVGPGAFAALPKHVPHTIRVEGDSADLILTLIPAGIERYFVPITEEDSDPATFGLEIHETVDA